MMALVCNMHDEHDSLVCSFVSRLAGCNREGHQAYDPTPTETVARRQRQGGSEHR